MQTIYCPNCGDPSPLGQKFCEKCGTQLPQSQAPPQQRANTFNPISSQIQGGLLDPNRMRYVVKEKFWDWGSGPILDQEGIQIGKMKRHVFSIRQRIDLTDMNDAVVASIHRKIISIRPTYTIYDNQERIIGRFQKTLLSIINPKFYLKSPDERIIFTAQGKFMGFDFQIYRGDTTSSSNMVAEIHKADRWKDVFFGGIWDFKDTYGVQIHDPSIDRRLLLGFVIAIDNVLHDQ